MGRNKKQKLKPSKFFPGIKIPEHMKEYQRELTHCPGCKRSFRVVGIGGFAIFRTEVTDVKYQGLATLFVCERCAFLSKYGTPKQNKRIDKNIDKFLTKEIRKEYGEVR